MKVEVATLCCLAALCVGEARSLRGLQQTTPAPTAAPTTLCVADGGACKTTGNALFTCCLGQMACITPGPNVVDGICTPPTPAPTPAPTVAPTAAPTVPPTCTCAREGQKCKQDTIDAAYTCCNETYCSGKAGNICVRPTPAPTAAPTPSPTAAPTMPPTAAPTPAPTTATTEPPVAAPTAAPTAAATSPATTPGPTTAAPVTPAPTAGGGETTPSPTVPTTPAPTTPAPTTPAPTTTPPVGTTSAPTAAPTAAATPAVTPAPSAATTTDAPVGTAAPTPSAPGRGDNPENNVPGEIAAANYKNYMDIVTEDPQPPNSGPIVQGNDGPVIAYIMPGEWAAYTLNVAAAGTYNVQYMLSGDPPAPETVSMHLVLGVGCEGAAVAQFTDDAFDPNTYNEFTGYGEGSIDLPAGAVDVTVCFDTAPYTNLQGITFTPAARRFLF